MPAQTLCKNLTKTSIEAIIDKSPGASEQIEIEQIGNDLLVKAKSDDAGGTAVDARGFVAVIQEVADAESKIVHTEAKKVAAEAAKAKIAAAKPVAAPTPSS